MSKLWLPMTTYGIGVATGILLSIIEASYGWTFGLIVVAMLSFIAVLAFVIIRS